MRLDKILNQTKPILGNNVSVRRRKDCLTNALYQLQTDNGYFALRVNSPISERLGIDRTREIAILDLINDQNWSLSSVDKSLDYLLTPWVFSNPLEHAPSTVQLSKLIQTVHSVNIDSLNTPPLNISNQLAFLMSQTTNPNPLFINCLNRYRHEYHFPTQLSLCHHDWHSGNLLQTPSQIFINDWEYAATGDPIVDVVCAIQGFSLRGRAKQDLIDDFSITPQHLKTIEPLVSALSLLWYQIRYPMINHDINIKAFIDKWS